MPLTAGDRLGPYEVVASIGAGGMGEVYRARDTKLKREVALKVLPDSFAADPDRLARFQREAEVLASLNHPHIAHLYGVEDRALVMELAEGETLTAPLPLETALDYARQIAEALEYAHEKGVIHRDLKPANIKVTPDGAVKLLDFGLAKAIEDPGSPAGDPANSPTLTLGATRLGVILGTAAYMSPEQAAGKRVDKRADIWSFGVVLWEMLTGAGLFEGGETVSHTLADVLRAPIDFTRLPASTPAPLADLLKRCLDRDVKTRLRDIGEARVAIGRYLANAGATVAAPPAFAPRRTLLPWALAGAFAAMAAAAGAWGRLHQPAPDTQSLRYIIDPPPATRFTNTYFATAVSPDGTMLVFGATHTTGGNAALWLRRMDSLDARELPGTDNSNGPFWSPDSKSIGFAAADKLMRVEVAGGTPQFLCKAPGFQGGTWNRDGVILFSSNNLIQRVPASGGNPAPVTRLASSSPDGYRFPSFLPDGRHFLFTIESADARTQGIYVSALDAPGQRIRLAPGGTKGVYAPPRNGYPGFLLWLRGQTLVAQRFDGQSRVEGEAAPLAEQVSINSANRRGPFWISDTGLLVYRKGSGEALQLLWVGRDGKREAVTAAGLGPISGDPRISPDGTRAALVQVISAAASDVWVYEFARGALTRLTFGGGNSSEPAWSPDAHQIAFSSNRTGVYQVYRKASNGTGQEERLTDDSREKFLMDWSGDGRYLLYAVQDPKTNWDIWALPLEGDRKPFPVLQSPFNESRAQFSPDGKWIAYESDESGTPQIYLQPFPPSGGKWQVSPAIGVEPRWRGDGKEIFYNADGGALLVAGVRLAAGSAQIDPPRTLFQHILQPGPLYFYDVARDGQRFLEFQPPADADAASAAALNVISNWQATLKR